MLQTLYLSAVTSARPLKGRSYYFSVPLFIRGVSVVTPMEAKSDTYEQFDIIAPLPFNGGGVLPFDSNSIGLI